MILIPFCCLLVWGATFRARGSSWIDALMAALVLFGLGVSVITELQSLTGTLSRSGSAIAWLTFAGVGLVVLRRNGARVPFTEAPRPRARLEEIVPAAVFLLLTAVVALVSAPNSYDGMSYHLTRVEQWIQQGSLRPFATHNTRQLFMPSWPEYAILQFRLLSGGDHFANLVQWLGFLGICGGAAMLARALGGARTAAALAAALVATLPMAVAQASGTQTDVIAACWAVAACGFGFRLLGAAGRPEDALCSALALGLAGATKQTALLFAGFALLPAIVLLAWRGQRRQLLGWMLASLLAVASIAGPQLVRNQAVFGNPRGDPNWITTVAMATRTPDQVLVNALRNLTVHFGTPWSPVNRAITGGVAHFARAIGVDPNDRRTTWDTHYTELPWNTHEEAAPNPLHLLIVVGACLALVRRKTSSLQLLFLTGLVAGFLTFCAELKWQSYNSRLQTPLFVLALAWAAVVLDRFPLLARRLAVGILMIGALPYALLNYTRPLIRLPGDLITNRPALLSVPRNLHYFLYQPQLAYAYRDVALRIADSGCGDVGLRDWPDAWEYPVIALVRNGGGEARFRAVDVRNVSSRFMTSASEPPCLLLQIGPAAAKPPSWAADWQRLVEWHQGFELAAIALFQPPPARQ